MAAALDPADRPLLAKAAFYTKIPFHATVISRTVLTIDELGILTRAVNGLQRNDLELDEVNQLADNASKVGINMFGALLPEEYFEEESVS